MKCYIEYQIKWNDYYRDYQAICILKGLEDIFAKLKGDDYYNIAISDPKLCELADDIVYLRSMIGRR